MRRSRDTAAYWDRRAASFDAIYSRQKSLVGRFWDRLTRRNIQDRLHFTLEALAPVAGRRILDVGCGSGRYCIELAGRGAAQIVGVDLSPRMLAMAAALARQHGVAGRCHFVASDILAYGTDVPFDDVIALGFFDYVRHPAPVLTHLRALTRSRLVASFPALWSFRTPFRHVWLALHRCHVRFTTRAEILRLCRETGFNCSTLVRHGPIYLLIAEPATLTLGG